MSEQSATDKRLVGYSIQVGHGLAVGHIFSSIQHAREQATRLGLTDYHVREEWH